jgi:hypothetical protein
MGPYSLERTIWPYRRIETQDRILRRFSRMCQAEKVSVSVALAHLLLNGFTMQEQFRMA